MEGSAEIQSRRRNRPQPSAPASGKVEEMIQVPEGRPASQDGYGTSPATVILLTALRLLRD